MSEGPLEATLVRELDVAAASGLVCVGDLLHVVADDEAELFTYRVGDAAFRSATRLFSAPLPGDGVAAARRTSAEHAARKRDKPDLEILLALDRGDRPALLALGSGSTAARARGAFVALDGGMPSGAVVAVDAAPLYAALSETFATLNLEGGAAVGDVVRLLQRGNGAGGENGVVDLDRAGVGHAIARGAPLDGSLVRRTTPVDLGALGGTPLGFTDASPLADGWLVFTAAAEASADTYADGPCAGSAIGLLDPEGRVRWCRPLAGPHKIEGVHARMAPDGAIELLLVADADDPSSRAPLLTTRFVPPRGLFGSDAR